MKTVCPHCTSLIPYSSRLAGRTATCPVCHQRYEMPSPAEQARLLAEDESLRNEQKERFERARQRRITPAEEATRYPALRFIANLLQFLAVTTLFLSVAGVVVVLLSGEPWRSQVQGLIGLGVAAVLPPVLLWGLGELIGLLIDMANDARVARQELSRLRRKKP
jgi:anti-sigma factor RsiW